MPKYCVTMLATSTMFKQVWTEAENEEQAQAFALAQAPTDPSDWEIEPDTAIRDVEVTSTEEDEQ